MIVRAKVDSVLPMAEGELLFAEARLSFIVLGEARLSASDSCMSGLYKPIY